MEVSQSDNLRPPSHHAASPREPPVRDPEATHSLSDRISSRGGKAGALSPFFCSGEQFHELVPYGLPQNDGVSAADHDGLQGKVGMELGVFR